MESFIHSVSLVVCSKAHSAEGMALGAGCWGGYRGIRVSGYQGDLVSGDLVTWCHGDLVTRCPGDFALGDRSENKIGDGCGIIFGTVPNIECQPNPEYG